MTRFSFLGPAWRLLPIGLLVLAAGCESPLNHLREQRFADTQAGQPIAVRPRALALSLRLAPDGGALSPESLQQANDLLGAQGRLQSQVLTVTPLRRGAEAAASRLAQALQRAGARAPLVMPVPLDAQRLEEARQNGWDLELQSEAIVAQTPSCGIADPDSWTVHPYQAIGSLGCANRANIARMVSDPRDLVRPRTLDGADGRAAAEAVERYQSGEIRDLIDINFEED